MQMNEIRRMAENNEDDALLEYLETWMLSLMVEDDLEIASLKKKLAITSDRLQQITAVNLHALGRFNLRGLLGEKEGWNDPIWHGCPACQRSHSFSRMTCRCRWYLLTCRAHPAEHVHNRPRGVGRRGPCGLLGRVHCRAACPEGVPGEAQVSEATGAGAIETQSCKYARVLHTAQRWNVFVCFSHDQIRNPAQNDPCTSQGLAQRTPGNTATKCPTAQERHTGMAHRPNLR